MNWRRPLYVLERHGYSRLVMEQQPAGDRCGRMQRNVDIVESCLNGPQPSMHHDDDDDDDGYTVPLPLISKVTSSDKVLMTCVSAEM